MAVSVAVAAVTQALAEERGLKPFTTRVHSYGVQMGTGKYTQTRGPSKPSAAAHPKARRQRETVRLGPARGVPISRGRLSPQGKLSHWPPHPHHRPDPPPLPRACPSLPLHRQNGSGAAHTHSSKSGVPSAKPLDLCYSQGAVVGS